MPGVRISVDPQEALIDEEVDIRLEGLPPNERVTIKASVKEGGIPMSSYGCYTATEQGIVSVRDQASLEGTYTGVEPMGLFWSLKWEPSYTRCGRMIKYDVNTPLIVTLLVIDGHYSWENLFDPSIKPLAVIEVRRRYKHKSIRRIEVKHGSTRGSLFIPPGHGPFPGVIDIMGATGGLLHYRGALLASKGFVVLCLSYYKYEDLPKKPEDITFDYFIESTEWFLGLPEVKNDGIGIIAMSKGGMFSLLLCMHFHQIKAVVLSSSVTFISDYPLKFSKGDIPNALHVVQNIRTTSEGEEILDVYQPTDDDFIKVWESSASVLCFVGDDDRCLNPAITERFIQLVPKEHRHRFQLLRYPDTGHFIDPPYSPCFRTSFHGLSGSVIAWGGSPKGSNLAQEDFWRRTVDFFSRRLGRGNARAVVPYKSSNL